MGRINLRLWSDGGITTYNNPAFQAFIMATVEPYNVNWATGENQMLIVSIGTRHESRCGCDLAAGEMNLLYNASSLPLRAHVRRIE